LFNLHKRLVRAHKYRIAETRQHSFRPTEMELAYTVSLLGINMLWVDKATF